MRRADDIARDLSAATDELERMRMRPYAGACGDADAVADQIQSLRRELAEERAQHVSIFDHAFDHAGDLTVSQAMTIAALAEFDETQTLEPVDVRIAHYGTKGDCLLVLNIPSPALNPIVAFWAGGDSYECHSPEQFDHYLAIWDRFETPTVEAIQRADDAVWIIRPGGSFLEYRRGI